MGGIGQLLYYRTLFRAWRGIQVNALVLAAPYLPPFILDTIDEVGVPIRYLKATDDEISGLVPDVVMTNEQRAAFRV